jgi:predicted RNase H-related nuclease YkuK (DUF458 family)
MTWGLFIFKTNSIMNNNADITFEDMKWKRMSKGPIKGPLFEYLEKIFEEETEKGFDIKVCIGTDSQRRGRGYRFATVIVISTEEDLGGGVTVGRGGIVLGTNYFTDKYKKNKAAVKERMLFEVSKSIDVAYNIAPLLDKYYIPLEIHADINPDIKWESSKALQDAVGYILGMGYDFKVKPEAWAASKGADRASRS